MKTQIRTLLLAAGVLAAASSPLAAGDKVVAVDCSKGESIQAALGNKAEPLVVEIVGTCLEDVLIQRDNVTLRGGAPGATVSGTLSPPVFAGGAITVDGASGVTLRDLVARDARRGVSVLNGGSAILERMTLVDNLRSGLTVIGSSFASLTDVSARDNGFFGFAAWDNSSLEIDGATVAEDNATGGFLLSASHAATRSSVDLEAHDNGLAGVVLQIGATAQAGAAVSGDQLVGLWVFDGSSWVGGIDASGNDVWGVLLEAGAVVEGTGSLVGNGCFGVQATSNSTFTFSGDSSGNPCGLVFDAVYAGFTNSMVADGVSLAFGTIASFGGTNTFTGHVACDGTELIRGDVACSPPLDGSSPAPPGPGADARSRLPAGRFELSD